MTREVEARIEQPASKNLLKTVKTAARAFAVTAVITGAIFATAPTADAATSHSHHARKHQTHKHHARKHHAAKHTTHKTSRPASSKPAASKPVTTVRTTAYRAAAAAPLSGNQLYVTPTTPAALALATATGSTRDALAKIAAQSQAQWMAGPWISTAKAQATAAKLTAGARETGAVLPLVLYNIPHRDCSQYSSGGAASAADYQAWIDQVAAGIGSARALVILEPDALGQLEQANCLTAAQQTERLSLLRYATTRLQQQPGVTVYLDAGNANWQSPQTIAARLKAAGIDQARGFSLNVSNFDTTANEAAYGQQVSALVGGKHFVIDTSRNGNGAVAHVWCNPTGRALGERPTLTPGIAGVDALLWVKTVGVSDGNCHPGDAPAGTFSVSYAVGLATRAHW